MRLIDADKFREELLRDLREDANMYNSHGEKEIRDDQYRFAIDKLDEQSTIEKYELRPENGGIDIVCTTSLGNHAKFSFGNTSDFSIGTEGYATYKVEHGKKTFRRDEPYDICIKFKCDTFSIAEAIQ